MVISIQSSFIGHALSHEDMPTLHDVYQQLETEAKTKKAPICYSSYGVTLSQMLILLDQTLPQIHHVVRHGNYSFILRLILILCF